VIQPLFSLSLAADQDVVNARQRARSIAEALGFDHHDQIRIATATSEIARNAFRYARGGTVSFEMDPENSLFLILVSDTGAGIPHLDRVMAGSYRSTTGMGMGILGTKRLMDDFAIESSSRGTSVRFGKLLPPQIRPVDSATLKQISELMARRHPATPLEELQTQNRELMKTLDELRERKEELARINSELQDTNRGVVALYAELDERADYLRRASELKSSFLSNMSHEFRTPLNSMLALTRMLLDRMDGELTGEQEQQIRFIQQSANELAEMVNDLLDLAKVEAGRVDIRAKTFEVSELFGALRGMLKPLLAENSLNLIFEPADTLEPLYTDEQKVSQVLRNFISNAIKFTPGGEVRVSAQQERERVIFSVTDTGIGISEGDQRVIFEEFAQIESSMQKRVKGTGLGLPLSRKLAQLLGGDVELESAVGMGSCFRLIIPRVFPGEAPPQQPALPEFDPSRKLVLIVEDNPETAFVYSRYLGGVGFQTHSVTTIEGAKEILEKIRPDAVILDVLLHAETSWGFLRELKADPRAIPVLVMSVITDERRIYGLGADAFLTKPFIPEQMINEIMRLTSATERLRILMIDDNEVSRYLLRENIAEVQYEIFEARDGREGLRMAREIKPALVFLDFFMPDLNGAEVLREFKSTPDLSAIPLVLHSTKMLDNEELDFFRAQSVAIFPKQVLTLPDSAQRLRDLISAMTAHAQAEKSKNA
jgi:signal transduction histidine kinase/CheY-like chemotaxis protein